MLGVLQLYRVLLDVFREGSVNFFSERQCENPPPIRLWTRLVQSGPVRVELAERFIRALLRFIAPLFRE